MNDKLGFYLILALVWLCFAVILGWNLMLMVMSQ